MLNYLYFLISVPVGMMIAEKVLRPKKKYFWYDFFGLFTIPFVTLFFLYLADGKGVLIAFFAWALAGPVIEVFVGRSYFSITGKHLWIYEKYPIFNRMTSYLTIPYWAFGGQYFTQSTK